MMVSDKIKALLAISGKKQLDLANEFEISAQSMNNKLALNRFNADELIHIANFTGCKIGFLLPNGEHIFFEDEDMRKKESPNT